MPDPAPSTEEVVERIRSSDRFSELIEEMAAHYHDTNYKDERLPELEETFAEEARGAGLSDDEAQSVAKRVKGQLMGQAQQQAPPKPAERLPPGDGPIPEARYEELPGPLARLLRLIEAEEKPFRQAHRLIDAVEWAVKWHTTLALSDLLSETDLPAEVKVLLAHGLRTPSLGLWNKFFRKSLDALEDPSLPWRSWERLTALEEKHNLVNFRNEYAHGATPPPEECREAVGTYLPVLKEMVHTPIFTDVGLAIRGEGADPQLLRGSERQALGIEIEGGHAAALLPDLDLNGEAPGERPWTERAQLDLWPLGLTATASMEHSGDADGDGEERPQFFYFNALKNEAVERLNYEEALLGRVPSLYGPFHEQLPLRRWKKAEGPDLERFRARIETLTEDFVGRREERERLRTFAAEGEGTLMVFGAPGIGKSALLAQVKREIEAGVDLDGRDLSEEMPPVIEYFIRSGESDDVTELLRHLCRRLDRRYGLSGHGLGSEPVDLSEQLQARLQAIEDQAREEGESPERTLLLVDGLDEGPDLGRYIPESRPWLPVLVSSRETEEARSFYENREIQARQEMTVGPLSAADVRALLYKVVSKYDPGLTEDYVQAVAERSEGNPLYLQLLAEQLFQGELEVGNIDALPDKVGELYEETVQRVTEGGENRMAEDTLLLLAEAQAPLSAGAMAGLLDERGSRVRSGLRAAMELLQRQDGEGNEPDRYQLFHETLREWLRTGDHAGDCAKINEQVAERCFQWTERREDGARGYALRHAAAHLKAAGRDEALYELLTDEGYQDAQVRATGQFDATYRAYEAGLEAYVERNGGTPENDVRLCRLALDAGQAAREAKEGVTQAFRWAEEGRMDDALQRIEVLGEEKYFLAALRLIWIEADRQAERPEEKRRAETAQEVLDAVEERIPPGTEAIDWSEVVDPNFMAQWASGVLKILPDIDVTGLLKRTSSLQEVNKSLATEIREAGEINETVVSTGVQIAYSIEGNPERAHALAHLAEHLADAGRDERANEVSEKALNSAQSIELHADCAECFTSIGDTLANSDQVEQSKTAFERALNVIQSIQEPHLQQLGYQNLIDSLINVDQAEMALEAIHSSYMDRDSDLEKLAYSLIEQGRNNLALKAAGSIDDQSKRDEVMTDLAESLTRAGNGELAMEAIGSVDNVTLHGKIINDLASALETNRDEQVDQLLERALENAHSIENKPERAKLFSTLALVLLDTERKERARDIFENALGAADSIYRDSLQVSILTDLANDLNNVGQHEWTREAFEQSLETAQPIYQKSDHDEALTALIDSFIKTGKVELAPGAANSIEDSEMRNRALVELTYSLIEIGEHKLALKAARSISEKSKCAEALTDVAGVLASTDRDETAAEIFEKAFSVAKSIGQKLERVEVFSTLAEKLLKAGREKYADEVFEQALETAQSIESDLHRSQALAEVVRTFGGAGSEDRSYDLINQFLRNVLGKVQGTQRLNFGPPRAETLSVSAVALFDAGRDNQANQAVDESLEVAQAIESDSHRVRTLASVADTLVDGGKAELAIRAAHSVRHNSDRAQVLVDLANALANAGHDESADDAFEHALKAAHEPGVLTDVAISSVRTGRDELANEAFERALEAADSDTVTNVIMALNDAGKFGESIDDFRSIDSILADLNKSAPSSWLEHSMDAVLSIDSNSASADAIVDIAKALASTGKFEQAVEFARSLNPDYEHKCAKAFIGILSAFANADEQRNAFLGRALNIACSIETARFRASVLARVACTLANTEQEKRAKDVFGQALEAARSADKEAHQAIALSDTASALGNVEENPLSNLMADEIYEEAITTANSEWSERDSALTHIARSLADAGRDERADEVFEEALETARSQELSRARDASLSSIANVLSSTGRCDLALEAAKSIDSRSSRNAALAKLSVVLSKSNEYEQASRVAHSIEDEAARNETLADVATALVDADQDRQPCTLFGQAIELACAIGDQSKRVRALATTVKIMAEGGNFDAASDLFGSLELDRSTWNDLLPAWRQALLEHTDEPRSLLRQSFAPYPFDAESAAKGVYSLVQAHVQAGAMDHAEAIARECPKLELDVLVQEPELPIPEGCDPDDLPVRQRAEYDTYVELYEEGTLDDAAFKSKVEELF